MSRALLITGATGKQGGAVVQALLRSNADFQILAVTRDAASASAKRLAAKSPKITLVGGNLDQPDSIFKAAKEVCSLPIWGVFSVQLPAFNKNGPTVEQIQGKALIDTSLQNNVQHFVYSSIDRHGPNSADNPTNIPHFISKHNIEQHLTTRAANTAMSWTILRPVAFMENFDGGFLGKTFATAWKVTVRSRPLQLVATEDIGFFAARAFLEPEWSRGRSISLAGDELTFEQMVGVFKEKTGTGPPMTWELLARFVLWMSKEMGTMFEFFEKEGYAADIGELRKVHPGLKDLKTWLGEKADKKGQ